MKQKLLEYLTFHILPLSRGKIDVIDQGVKQKLIFLCVFAIFAVNMFATTWQIKQDGTGDFTTIQAGIAASADSDTVLVYPGTYYENLNMNEKNIVLASLELITNDPQYIGSTIIDGQRLSSCIEIQYIEIGATIRGFTICNGLGIDYAASFGGGIFVQCVENTDIINCVISDNVAAMGGAIYACLSDLFFSGLRIVHNSAGFGGGILARSDNNINFDESNLCSIYNNNAGKGADLYIENTGNIEVHVDTFSVFYPDNYFAEYCEGSTYSFDIQHNWMELVPYDMYVAQDGDDANSGLSPDEPLRNISWAVRRIYADEQNPRTVHVASGYYSNEVNQQIYPIGCKEYVSIIGEGMNNTILNNDNAITTIFGSNLNGYIEITDFSLSNSLDFYNRGVVWFREINLVKMKNIKIQNNYDIRGLVNNEYVNNEYENIIISDNIVSGSNSGLGLHNNAGFIKNSVIINNENTWSDCAEVAFQLMANDNFTIENCIFSDNHSSSTEARIIRTTRHNSGVPTTPTIRFITV